MVCLGGLIVIFRPLIQGKINVAIKVQHQVKGVHCRGGAIFGGGADQSMGTEVRVGAD